jgi:hypothetical protein
METRLGEGAILVAFIGSIYLLIGVILLIGGVAEALGIGGAPEPTP